MRRRVYSDAERAAALAYLKAAGWEEGDHVTARMARGAGVPLGTLRSWASGAVACAMTANVRMMKTQAEASLADLCERVARLGLDYILRWHEQFEETAPTGRMFSPMMTSVGIAIEKAQLLRGGPTARLAIEDARRAIRDAELDPDEVIAEVNAIVRGGS